MQMGPRQGTQPDAQEGRVRPTMDPASHGLTLFFSCWLAGLALLLEMIITYSSNPKYFQSEERQRNLA